MLDDRFRDAGLLYRARPLYFAAFVSCHNELVIFTGLIGSSSAVNGGMRQSAPAKAPAPNPAYLPFRLPIAAQLCPSLHFSPARTTQTAVHE
jgi:hypothetical protein